MRTTQHKGKIYLVVLNCSHIPDCKHFIMFKDFSLSQRKKERKKALCPVTCLIKTRDVTEGNTVIPTHPQKTCTHTKLANVPVEGLQAVPQV